MAITSFKAGEAISAGNAVVVSNSGVLLKGIATSQAQASVVGIALDTSSTGGLIRVCSDSIYTGSSSFLPGVVQYLSPTTSGVLIDYPTWASQLTSLTTSGAFLTRIGRAISNTNLEVEIEKPIYVTK